MPVWDCKIAPKWCKKHKLSACGGRSPLYKNVIYAGQLLKILENFGKRYIWWSLYIMVVPPCMLSARTNEWMSSSAEITQYPLPTIVNGVSTQNPVNTALDWFPTLPCSKIGVVQVPPPLSQQGLRPLDCNFYRLYLLYSFCCCWRSHFGVGRKFFDLTGNFGFRSYA